MLESYKEKQVSFYNFITKVYDNNKISHAYLIETNGVSYGYDLALAMAKFFLCNSGKTDNSNCIDCSICKQIDDNNYLDLVVIDNDFGDIKKEQMLSLQKLFSTKSILGKYRIYIIKNANLLNKSSANTILKFLEEPEEGIIAILLTNNVNNVINTIVSRCQVISLCNNENGLKSLFNLYCSGDLTSFYDEYLKKIIDFYVFLEEKGFKLISYKDDYVLVDIFKLYLEVGVYFYFDILKCKFNMFSDDFALFELDRNNIVKNNDICAIINKIDILNQFLLNVNYNVNMDLFVDNFIITFGGVDK